MQSKDAGHRLRLFYITGTLVGNGLRKIVRNVMLHFLPPDNKKP